MNDVLIIEAFDGGELVYRNHDLVGAGLYDNMIYLALFGGDEWYLNGLIGGDASLQYTGRTERVCRTVALNSTGRLAIEEAANDDLAFLLEHVPGSKMTITVTITGVNRIRLDVVFNGVLYSYTYSRPDNTLGVVPGDGLYVTEDGSDVYVDEDGEGYSY
ncbi:MAG: hypothetical protein KF744_09075 [Taibaiella sp.]|nr:hypothetical protein [Taibaiella sp.]